jgi:hypothetical protein
MSSLRPSTTMTATFAVLQNISYTEARQGRNGLRQVSNPGDKGGQQRTPAMRVSTISFAQNPSKFSSEGRAPTRGLLPAYGQ